MNFLKYRAYLRSGHWERTRLRKLLADGRWCQRKNGHDMTQISDPRTKGVVNSILNGDHDPRDCSCIPMAVLTDLAWVFVNSETEHDMMIAMVAYYAAAKRSDGDIPGPHKAAANTVFYHQHEARKAATKLAGEYGVPYVIVKATITAEKIVETVSP